jgi:adenylate cyclase
MRPFKDREQVNRILAYGRQAGLPETPPLPLPDKPSIAVLPFVNMSGDPEQEYFSDGMTEEIITALSKVPKMFVIARHSSFTYKGKPIWVPTVGKELGVRYVLEGSVRKSGDKLRITAQLIDAQTNKHIWAERYDRDLKDIFAIQDAVTLKIITALQVKLSEGEEIRIYARGTENLEAYLKFLEGRRHLHQASKERNALAKQSLKEAIALDPQYPAAYAFLAMTHMRDVALMITKTPKKSLAEAIELAKKATTLDDSLADAHALLGWLYTNRRQHEKGIEQGERAVALNPNSASAYHWYGLTLNYAGRHEEAIKSYKKALRLNPFPPTRFYFCLAIAYRDARRYDDAIAASKKALEQAPNCLFAHTCLASCYALMGRQEEAHAEIEESLRINPKLSLASIKRMVKYKYEADSEFLIESLRKAGLK